MENILHKEGMNIGGNARLYFTRHTNIGFMPPIVQGIIANDLLMVAGTYWHELWVTRYSLFYNESLKYTDAGMPAEVNCGFIFSKDTPELVYKLELMRRERLALLLLDQNGNVRLIGNRHEYVYHSVSYTTGQLPADHNKYDIVLAGQLAKRSVFYGGEILKENIEGLHDKDHVMLMDTDDELVADIS